MATQTFLFVIHNVTVNASLYSKYSLFIYNTQFQSLLITSYTIVTVACINIHPSLFPHCVFCATTWNWNKLNRHDMSWIYTKYPIILSIYFAELFTNKKCKISDCIIIHPHCYETPRFVLVQSDATLLVEWSEPLLDEWSVQLKCHMISI